MVIITYKKSHPPQTPTGNVQAHAPRPYHLRFLGGSIGNLVAGSGHDCACRIFRSIAACTGLLCRLLSRNNAVRLRRRLHAELLQHLWRCRTGSWRHRRAAASGRKNVGRRRPDRPPPHNYATSTSTSSVRPFRRLSRHLRLRARSLLCRHCGKNHLENSYAPVASM